jgi:DNA-binding MarR family transcriptional regulator
MAASRGDFDRPRDFLVDAMRDVFLGTAAELGRRLQRTGFYSPTPTQIAIMSLIPMSGIRATDLARRTQVTKQAVDQMVDQLERVKVLVRTPDPTDARARLIRPTPYAMRAYAASRRILTEIHQEWRRRLGDDRYAELERALAVLRPPEGMAPRATRAGSRSRARRSGRS